MSVVTCKRWALLLSTGQSVKNCRMITGMKSIRKAARLAIFRPGLLLCYIIPSRVESPVGSSGMKKKKGCKRMTSKQPIRPRTPASQFQSALLIHHELTYTKFIRKCFQRHLLAYRFKINLWTLQRTIAPGGWSRDENRVLPVECWGVKLYIVVEELL